MNDATFRSAWLQKVIITQARNTQLIKEDYITYQIKKALFLLFNVT